MPAKKENKNLGSSLKKLEEIVNWFEEQKEVDVEDGLEKVKQGVELIKYCRSRLAEVKNEFEEVKKELDKENIK
ncbi:MAG: exodeoxyribonuclease VII small subunit [Parcubacteria group bacterium ADurb.Bin159]|jgi:exodeoxyribonuclease VII small subunit|nr:MAG: exodeoxyribonuclease VII small subunit [Parcubacteria group bacterium ADurb.Bin159]